MNRRELYQFVEALRDVARRGEPRRARHLHDGDILDAFHVAMAGRPGRDEPGDFPLLARAQGQALTALLDQDQARELLDADDTLGRVYQALNAPALEAAYRATARQRRKFSSDEIPAVSQLFTPRWVVEFLLHNTLGRLWVELHPDTRLLGKLNWLVDRDRPAQANGVRQVSEIRLLDPACGTMNFGLVAFELFDQMYREEIDRAGEAEWSAAPSIPHVADIPRAILRNNLFGIDIDPVALKLARASLQLKSGAHLPDDEWNLWLGDSLFDDAIAGRCVGGFDVVATNPPYVSSRNLPAAQVAKMKKRFPAGWRDLYACFIARSLELARDGGWVGLLVMQSFMFTGSYQKLRGQITRAAAIETLAHFGPGLFEIGNPGTLQTVAFSARKESDERRGSARMLSAFRLAEIASDRKQSSLQSVIVSPAKIGAAVRFDLPQSALVELPRQSWAYWVDGALRKAFWAHPRLGDVSPPRQGLATTDNFRFVRYWWEVEPLHADSPAKATPGKWFPYAKSGQFRRWYESPRHRVNWMDDGREIKQSIALRYPYLNGEWRWVAKNSGYYGRVGVTWSYLTSGRFSARRLEPGAIFDVAGSSLFPDDIPGMLALLNSSVIHRLLEVINPTVNFQVGDLAELPIPRNIPAELGALAESAIAIQRQMDECDETAPDFVEPLAWENAIERLNDRTRDLGRIEQEIDEVVCELYSLKSARDLAGAARFQLLVPSPPGTGEREAAFLTDLARRWVSFCVGRLLGRWNGSTPGRVLRIDPPDPDLVVGIRQMLAERLGRRAAHEIESHVAGIGRFLASEFCPWHVRLYRQRPPYWGLRLGNAVHLIAHDAVTPKTLATFLTAVGVSLPADWQRRIDDGIQTGLLPFRSIVADPAMKAVLKKVAANGRTASEELTCESA